MKKYIWLTILIFGLLAVAQLSPIKDFATVPESPTVGSDNEPLIQLPEFTAWKRPDGPLKVGLQVGHWKQGELPEELQNLRTSTGTSGGGKNEWEVNYTIAETTATLLREYGVEVEILPATIPPDYWADVFLSIHADGSTSTSASGYKVASPRFDRTGKAADLVAALEDAYGEQTGLAQDPEITRNMRGYYAFNYRRYDHAIHPMATAAIIETGFLTNASDRKIIVQKSDTAAQGIATGILRFFNLVE